MGWKVSCAMDERVQFVGAYLSGDRSMTTLCAQYGISRKTGYKWVSRYRSRGVSGLEERSRAPHHPAHAVSEAVIEAILARRDKRPEEGPLKIRRYLETVFPEWGPPAASTIAAILKTYGRVKARRRGSCAAGTVPAQPLGAYAEPNEAWCADFKGWFCTGDGRRCTPLTITDAVSRYLVLCQGLDGGLGVREVQPLFERAFREYGLPEVIRTDNGPPFGSPGLGGLSALSIWFLQLAIRPEHIRPGKPQDNGRHERMHRTLKALTARPPRGSLRAQQRAFDEFIEYYNFERPHQALGQRPPGCVYRPSTRPFPHRLLVPEYPREWTVRKVKHKGGFLWGGQEYFLSQVLAGHHVGLKPIDDDAWLIYFFTIPLAVFEEPEGRIRPYRPEQPL